MLGNDQGQSEPGIPEDSSALELPQSLEQLAWPAMGPTADALPPRTTRWEITLLLGQFQITLWVGWSELRHILHS